MHAANLIIGYNTNGFYGHALEDATRILADLGYGGIALTPDVHHLNPFTSTPVDLEAYRRLLEELDLQLVIETGARFILDSLKKHFPTLMTLGEGARRLEFLRRCVDAAERLGARLVSFHSGASAEALPKEEGLKILSSRIAELLEYAASKNIPLALEPEPGMFIETLDDYRRAAEGLPPPGIRMTLDVGHAHITERETVAEVVRAYRREIINVHLDDARGGRHEHLPLGEGEIDFHPVLRELAGTGTEVFLSVELSRHGHDAVNQARQSMAFLKGIIEI